MDLTLEQKLEITWQVAKFKREVRAGKMPAPIIKPDWWKRLSPAEEEQILVSMKALIRENKGMERNDKY